MKHRNINLFSLIFTLLFFLTSVFIIVSCQNDQGTCSKETSCPAEKPINENNPFEEDEEDNEDYRKPPSMFPGFNPSPSQPSNYKFQEKLKNIWWDSDQDDEDWLTNEKKETEYETKVIMVSKPDDCSEFVQVDDTASFHFTGYLRDGTVFETSRFKFKSNGKKEKLSWPFKVKMGLGLLAVGWEKGVIGMCAGEKRHVIVPPQEGFSNVAINSVMAYIPPNSWLYFELELISLEKYDGSDDPKLKIQEEREKFKSFDLDGNKWITKEEHLIKIMELMSNNKHMEMKEKDPEAFKALRKESIRIVRDIFRSEDKNRDGEISYREWMETRYRTHNVQMPANDEDL